MDYDEQTVQQLSAHLNELAGMSGEYGVKVEPVRVGRGVWAFHVHDAVGGDYMKEGTTFGYRAVLNWIRTGLDRKSVV